MDTKDLAYMAGLVDMRCTVGLNKERLFIRATVTKMPQVARFLQRMVGGGSLIEVERGDTLRSPCRIHCDHKHQEIGGSIFRAFALYGVRAAIVLFNLEPFLMRWDEYESSYAHFRGRVLKMDKIKTQRTVADMRQLGWEIPEWLEATAWQQDA